MNAMDFEILNLDSFNPEMDIVIMYVDIGNMPPQRAAMHLQQVKEAVHPKFEARGFDVLYVARNRDGDVATKINVISKDAAEREFSEFDDAMKLSFGE